ncbi:hypothetical protein ACWDV4_13445 [Micromonospora sp. NPDC003197]|uniref:Uncharacterized protein n=1 Tax=Micromonospora polyrhachis TaxID=1282883 RepID=A0A7W7SYM6_9ACTN|nr:hypothetical protein [Micromonospora polyrhachis]MBB4962085.1 hypothetical protein [Micromonospora polyrhachis]
MTAPEEEHEKSRKTDAVLRPPSSASPAESRKVQPKAAVEVEWNEGEPVEPTPAPREER